MRSLPQNSPASVRMEERTDGQDVREGRMDARTSARREQRAGKQIFGKEGLRPLAPRRSLPQISPTSARMEERTDGVLERRHGRTNGRTDAKQRAGENKNNNSENKLASAKRRKTKTKIWHSILFRRPLLVPVVYLSVSVSILRNSKASKDFSWLERKGTKYVVGTRRRPKSSNIFPPRPGAEATGRSGIVSRCNNLHTYTLFDDLYIFHTGMCSHLFVFVFRYLALYLYVICLLNVCILHAGSISISIHVYLPLNVDLFPPRPGAEATGRGGIVSRSDNFHACPLHDIMFSCFR